MGLPTLPGLPTFPGTGTPSSIGNALGTNPFNVGQNAASLWRTLVTKIGKTNQPPTASQGWTPPQWNRNTPEVTCIATTATPGNPSTQYYFDAVFKTTHTREVTVTHQPVQSGAPVADHTYVQPARVEVEIGMSDAMSEYKPVRHSVGPKSVNAYQVFINLQLLRSPVTLLTRLMMYPNMIITNIRAVDDKTTIRALKATIMFEQIIQAQVSTVTVGSAGIGGGSGGGTGTGLGDLVNGSLPQTTENTQLGTLVGQDAPSSIDDNYKMTPYTFVKTVNYDSATGDIMADEPVYTLSDGSIAVADPPGAGDYSSSPVTNKPQP
jgi:Dit-like phage tail protein